jgi:hypothetical protein
MTRDDIIRLAREAGCAVYDGEDIAPALVRFAALVEQHLVKQGYRKCAEGQKTTQFCGMLEEAVKAEREACAELAERMDFHSTLTGFLVSPDQIADAIRARGQ